MLLAVNECICHLNHFFAFGLRWGQPGQQQGLRFPSRSSSCNLAICSFLVSGFFTIVIQQIHSLRARAVRPFHFSSTFLSEAKTFLKSSGTSCTTPSAIIFIVIAFYLV